MNKPLLYGLVLAFGLVCLSSQIWHWGAALRVLQQECRFEIQRSEMAFSFWLSTEDYRVEGPLVWAHPADADTRLVEGCSHAFGGIGLNYNSGNGPWSNGVWSGAVVMPWWFALLALLLGLWSGSQVKQRLVS